MNKILATMILLLVALAPAFAATTSAANVKGTYSFQVGGVTNQYGYYTSCSGSGNCTWVPVDNGTCPTGQSCQNQTFSKAAVGSILFDGIGTATFLSFTQYNSGGSGNPVKGTTCTYTVSGYVANLTNCATKGVPLDMGTVTLTLGGFNAAKIATTMLLFSTDDNSNTNVSTGIATLQ